MRFVAGCPRCERKLQVPEVSAGAEVRCPNCLVTFTAPVAPAVAPLPVPARRSKRTQGCAITGEEPGRVVWDGITAHPEKAAEWTDRAAWGRVHGGLGWIVVGLRM